MQAVNVAGQGDLASQPESSAVAGVRSNSGYFHGIRCYFYRYEPLRGTCVNWLTSSAVVAGSAGVGAIAGDLLLSKLPAGLAAGTTLLERGVQKVEDAIQQHPILCGATAGVTTAACGIYMLSSSLKPLTQESIQALRDKLANQLHRDYSCISNYREQIAHHQQRFNELKVFLPEEQARNEREARALYTKQMARYQQSNSYILGQLQEQVDGIFARHRVPGHLPTYDEATTERGTASIYKAGREVANFINGKTHSLWAQDHLLEVMKPVLTAEDLEKVKKTLSTLPWKPVLYIGQGPREKEFNQIKNDSSVVKGKMGLLEANIREIVGHFPVLKPDSEGKIPKPAINAFAGYLPE
ncbi:hypothetical protein [Endozoicomonas sp.]|uniref:hypothetical protein n=1 Tax=Endozoicomonas sp. TaxID=1892382 RepID=UPI00383A93C5